MLKKVIEFVKNFDLSLKSIGKVIVLTVMGVVLLAVTLAILGITWRFVTSGSSFNLAQSHTSAMPMAMSGMMDEFGEMFGSGFTKNDLMMRKSTLGLGMVASMPEPYFDNGVSQEMEDYERISYNAEIERYEIETVCDEIEALKPLDYVVFKNANRSDKNCSYRFSVESEHEVEVVNTIRALDPKEFNTSVDTREPAVSGNVFEREILESRLESIQDSLKQAEDAYGSAITLATNRGNVESLAALINGKLELIERLSNQKRSVAQQLARLVRGGDRTLSETEYAHFNVQVSKKQIVDWEGIGSTWRYGVDEFVGSVNKILQGLTFGLILFALMVFKFLVYLFVFAAFARLTWVLARKVWKWNGDIRRLLK